MNKIEKAYLLKIKKYYDETGSMEGVKKKLNIHHWRIRKALREGHRLGLFVYNKYYKGGMIKCRNCKKFFWFRLTRSIYCSKECKIEAREKSKIKIICRNCGKITFIKPPHAIRDKSRSPLHIAYYRNYCSRKCFSEAREKSKIKIMCRKCGIDIVIYPSITKLRTTRYCSTCEEKLLKEKIRKQREIKYFIGQLRSYGYTYKEIANMCNISGERVRQIVANMGITPLNNITIYDYNLLAKRFPHLII